MSAELITILWRDIPAQIVAKEGRATHRIELPPRFQVAIDRAAMEAGLIGTDDYLAEWRRESAPLEGDMEEQAKKLASQIDASFSPDSLNSYIQNQGRAPEGTS